MMRFGPGEVHVWRIELECSVPELDILRSVLPLNEIEKALRFRTPELTRLWVAAHGALRSILGRYVGLKPMDLALREGAHGKPELVPAANTVFFNLTHTRNLAFVIGA